MKIIHIFIFLVLQSKFLLSQSIHTNHFKHKISKILFDAGENWDLLSSLNGVVFNQYLNPFKNSKTNFLNSGDWGFIKKNNNNDYTLKYFNHSKFYKNYYIYFSPKIKLLRENFNGDKYNFNFISGMGYEKKWFVFQIGSGNESWGAGDDIELALSTHSNSYNYLLLSSDYGKIRVRYIHGFLENVNENVNRYITARGIEWTNKSSFIIGLSETVVYSGINRALDIAYMNPISSHLEIELNNRLNINGNSNSNAVWQFHVDYLLNKNIRLSLNYLIDEFVLDPGIEIGKENGKAYSYRISYTPFNTINHLFTFYTTLVYVGTPTFRHNIGTNNFVQKNKPLGWIRGSDGSELTFGINYFNKKNIIFSFLLGFLKTGDETILKRIFDPYEDYLKGDFPSGSVEHQKNINTKLSYLINKKTSLSLELDLKSEHTSMINIEIGIIMFHKKRLSKSI